MTARQLDGAAVRLHELRALAYEELGLAALAFALAVVASLIYPPLALPFLVGALAMTALGLRSFVRGCFLVEDLAEEPGACSLPEVRRFCARAASPGRRRELAAQLRASGAGAHVELTDVVAALEDERRSPAPHVAVALERRVRECVLLLHDPSTTDDDLHACIRRLRQLTEAQQ